MVTQPSGPPQPPARQVFVVSPQSVEAALIAIVLTQGEPLVNPTRISLAIARPDIERAAGRSLTFEYVQDELNPFGRLDIIVLD